MNDGCIEIGVEWMQDGIILDDGFDIEISFESDFDVELETEDGDGSEIHLVVGEIVEESLSEETEYDFAMEFASADTSFVYVGPALPAVEVEWSTDAWFRNDGWFRSEAW